MDITPLDSPIEQVRKNPEMYLFSGFGIPIAERLMLGLVSDAIALGATNINWLRERNSHFVGSTFNWLGLSGQGVRLEFFDKVVPLEGSPPNSIRHEICLTALCSDVALVGEQVMLVRGTVEAFGADWLSSILQRTHSKFGIAFIFSGGSPEQK